MMAVLSWHDISFLFTSSMPLLEAASICLVKGIDRPDGSSDDERVVYRRARAQQTRHHTWLPPGRWRAFLPNGLFRLFQVGEHMFFIKRSGEPPSCEPMSMRARTCSTCCVRRKPTRMKSQMPILRK